MICKNCNANNPDGVKFCSECGAPIQPSQAPTQIPPKDQYGDSYNTQFIPSYGSQNYNQYNQSPQNFQPEPPKKSKTPIIIISIIAGLAVIGGSVASVFFFGNKLKENRLIGSSLSDKETSELESEINDIIDDIDVPDYTISFDTESSASSSGYSDSSSSVSKYSLGMTDEEKIRLMIDSTDIDSYMDNLGGDTMDVKLYAEGSTMVYEFKYKEIFEDTSLLIMKESFDKTAGQASFKSTYQSIAKSLKSMGVSNPCVRVVYKNGDGNIIAEYDFFDE